MAGLPTVRIGDVVYWYGTRGPNAHPLPAIVVGVDGTALVLNVQDKNRVTTKPGVLHGSDSSLKNWPADDLARQGFWGSREDHWELEAKGLATPTLFPKKKAEAAEATPPEQTGATDQSPPLGVPTSGATAGSPAGEATSKKLGKPAVAA